MKELLHENVEELKKLYNMYEFTDDILFISSDVYNYPNIFNFVKTGVLTIEEAIDALLYHK